LIKPCPGRIQTLHTDINSSLQGQRSKVKVKRPFSFHKKMTKLHYHAKLHHDLTVVFKL